MKITKEMKFESSHIVRNAHSTRCKSSIHGHSYKVLATFEARHLDKAGMILDFGILNTIKNFVDCFDHTHVIWAEDDVDYKTFSKRFSKRWISMPLSPSAECLALTFLQMFRIIIESTELSNGEDLGVNCVSVQVYETATGSATAELKDLGMHSQMPDPNVHKIRYSKDVMEDWGEFKFDSINAPCTVQPLSIKNPKPEIQVVTDIY